MIDAPIPQFAVDAASYQRLRPLMRTVAHNEDVARLARGLSLSEGFAFHLASCETPQIAQALLLCLAKEVPELRGSPVKISRLVPTRAPDEPLESWALGREFFDRVFIPDPEPRIICLDATDSRSDDRDAWIWLLQRLNERRNHLYALGVPLLFLFPFDLSLELTKFAPDLWSIRSVGVKLSEGNQPQRRSLESPMKLPAAEEATRSLATAPLGRLEENVAALLTQQGPHAKRALVVEFRRLAEVLHDKGETERALECLQQQILPHLLQDTPPALRASLMMETVETLVRMDCAAEAERLARTEVLPTLDQDENSREAAVLLSRLADAYRASGDHGKALALLRQEALPRVDGRRDPETTAALLSKVVVSLIDIEDLDGALEILHDDSFRLSEWLPPQIASYMFLAVAEALRKYGKPTAAIELLRRRVIPSAVEALDASFEALAWVVLGQAHHDRGELQEAIASWRSHAVPLYQRLGQDSNSAVVNGLISGAARGELPQSRMYTQAGPEVFADAKDDSESERSSES